MVVKNRWRRVVMGHPDNMWLAPRHDRHGYGRPLVPPLRPICRLFEVRDLGVNPFSDVASAIQSSWLPDGLDDLVDVPAIRLLAVASKGVGNRVVLVTREPNPENVL